MVATGIHSSSPPDLELLIPEEGRFTRIYRGQRELIEHILVSHALTGAIGSVTTGGAKLSSVTDLLGRRGRRRIIVPSLRPLTSTAPRSGLQAIPVCRSKPVASVFVVVWQLSKTEQAHGERRPVGSDPTGLRRARALLPEWAREAWG